jgi:hypothetical protein
MADPIDIQLPPDIPWRRLALPGRVRTEGGFPGLSPSISAFYFPYPTPPATPESPPGPFGTDRILLLKVVATFTGLAPSPPQAKAVAKAAFGTARILGIDALDDLPKTYVPCFGGAIHVMLESASGGVDSAYIRDIFPRRQEMVVHEVVGTETLNRQSTTVSVTKTSNLTGGASYAGVSASASQGTTSTAESQRESSQRNSHTTNVEHVYHLLTAYHLGSDQAVLTVQPRPFEGEYWELVGGIRKVEGIQECVITVHIPTGVSQLGVRVRFYPGWFWTQPGPIALRRPLDPAERAEQLKESLKGHEEEFLASILIENAVERAETSIKAWERWISVYRRWVEVQSFLGSTFGTDVHTMVSQAETAAEITLSADGLTIQDTTPTSQSLFVTDTLPAMHYSPTSQGAEAFQARLQLNDRMSQLGEKISACVGQDLDGAEFERTAFARSWFFSTMALLAVKDPGHPALNVRVPKSAVEGLVKPHDVSEEQWRNNLEGLERMGEFARVRLGGDVAEPSSKVAGGLHQQLRQRIRLDTLRRGEP